MKKIRREQIDSFFEKKRFSIAGVSRNPKKFGFQVFHDLRKKGFDILPVNPTAEEIDGVKCYKSVESLPSDVDSLLILTPKTQTDDILRQAIQKGIRNIWVQQMSNTEETLKIAEEYDKEIIHGKCVFMFAEPVGSIHKFHRSLVRIFGGLPK
ncbi:MAG: CoA-binding protein [Bacteroidales bacterium]|nr:CoA-binding protein [Bacteroidales bacterium]